MTRCGFPSHTCGGAITLCPTLTSLSAARFRTEERACESFRAHVPDGEKVSEVAYLAYVCAMLMGKRRFNHRAPPFFRSLLFPSHRVMPLATAIVVGPPRFFLLPLPHPPRCSVLSSIAPANTARQTGRSEWRGTGKLFVCSSFSCFVSFTSLPPPPPHRTTTARSAFVGCPPFPLFLLLFVSLALLQDAVA